MSRDRRGPIRGVLFFLGMLLLASGAIRLGFGLQTAQAVTAPTPPQPGATQCPLPPAEMIAALQEREARAATLELSLAERRAALSLTEAALQKTIDELARTEATLSETLARADGAAEQDLGRLTAVFEAMKPKEAAQLFEAMAPEFASGFLGRMRPDAAAAVLSGMRAESAYSLSVLLAGRNALVPKQ